jgi:hypothetical protein
MSTMDEKLKQFAANSIFPSFFFALFGLVLTQVGAQQVKASLALHVYLGMPGLALSALVLYRARLHYPTSLVNMLSLRPHVFGWHSLLLMIGGALIGQLASTGSALLVGMVALLAYLLSWKRIAACRVQFFGASVLLLAGAIGGLLLAGRSIPSLYFMIVGWILCVSAMSMYLFVLATLDRSYRIGRSNPVDEPEVKVRLPLA